MKELSLTVHSLGCAMALLAAVLVCGSGPARAQQEEADTGGAPWLQVEVLVFRHLDSALAGDEAWPAKPELTYPPDIRILSQPGNIEQSVPALSEASAMPPVEQPFVALGPGARVLDEAAARIAGSAAYRLLGHFAWRQPAPTRGTRTSILLTGGEAWADHFELEGSISVSRPRSLQIDTQLWLNDFAPSSLPAAQSSGVELPAIPQPVSEQLEPESIEQVATVAQHATRTVLLAENRHVRVGEVHYIDHPLFAVLLKLQAYDPAAAAGTTPSDPIP